jgi:RNA-binding protein 25
MGPYGVQPPMFPRGGFPNPNLIPFQPQMNVAPRIVPLPVVVAPSFQRDPIIQQLTALGLEPVITNVWVGKICPLVEDFIIKKLLNACGVVSTWTRVEANGQLKTFGFCKYANAEGALRSLRLLNGLSIGTEQLHLKVDQNTTEYLDEYEKKRKTYLETFENGENKGPILPILDIEAGDKAAKEIIETITEQVTKALNEEEEGVGVVSKEVRAFREKQMKLEKERKEKEEQEEKRKRQREEEEKQQLKRQQEREDRELRDKERKWCDYEKERARSRKDYFEEIKERQIKRKQCLLLDDEDDKSHRKKIKSRESRKKRLREKEDDDHEKAKEDHEMELIRREQEKQEEEARRKKEEERKRIQEMAEKTKMDLERMKEEKLRMERLQQERILQERQQADKMRVERQEQDEKKKTAFSVSLNQVGQLAVRKQPSATATSMFSAESDDSNESNLKKKRKLMVLEHEVGNHEMREEQKTILDAKAKAQAVIDKIPTQKADLFKFPIDWAIVDQYKIVEDKMNGWVKKKIVEYLGEEEQSLINYICKKLTEHTPPDLLLENLLQVLEDEASDFVIRMWRMLIYNILMITNDK